LKAWADNRWLFKHELSREEAENLLALADRDISAAASYKQYTDWQFNIAYTAILSLAKLALGLAGYRTGRTAHHYYLIRSLEFTLGIDTAIIALLDTYRTRRHELTMSRPGLFRRVKRRKFWN
jgi:hypothetical protein